MKRDPAPYVALAGDEGVDARCERLLDAMSDSWGFERPVWIPLTYDDLIDDVVEIVEALDGVDHPLLLAIRERLKRHITPHHATASRLRTPRRAPA